ncbi:tRNA modification GTPase MnmE [Raoultella terrigena]|uniref:tRNA modification GTPase MnmE n=1 Tax=Raoultella terrigena TaxID=577 RepID=A0A4U9D4N6_RAOTE|nr:tRNA modification GTPase MnmE [Raoultella terrigena]
MSHNDTIVAQATPPGRGGVGILRISGLKAREVAEAVLGKLPKPRYADYLPFKDVNGTALDQGIALWFPGPNSFTGEDVLELQGTAARSFSICCSTHPDASGPAHC